MRARPGVGEGHREEVPLPASLSLSGCRWSLTHSERYALQFADGHRKYITENNRTEIKNGSILCLCTAPVMPLLAHPLLPCPSAGPLAPAQQCPA